MRKTIPLLAALGLTLAYVEAADVPPGYELVQITPGDAYYTRARMNNQGRIVFMKYQDGPDPTAQIILYDNGRMIAITTDAEIQNASPDINDAGDIVWSREIGPFRGARRTHEIMMYRNGEIVQLTDNNFGDGSPRINNLGHIAWTASMPPCQNAGISDIYFYDGRTIRRITAGDANNQCPKLNDLDQIIWTRYNTECSGFNRERAVMLYAANRGGEMHDGDFFQVSDTGSDRAFAGSINNLSQIVWTMRIGPCASAVQLWENGVNVQLLELGGAPLINDAGDVAFYRFHHERSSYQAYLYHQGEVYQVSDNYDVHWNLVTDINDHGELVYTSGEHGDSDIMLLRRTLTGNRGSSQPVSATSSRLTPEE